MKKNHIALAIFLGVSFAIQLIGGLFTKTSVTTWYPTLQKAAWNPPGWVFGPVWTALYILIAISGWLVFIQNTSPTAKKKAFIVYGGQLLFNFFWSFFFFYLQSPFLGVLDILVLFILICINIYLFYPLSKPAAYLLVPYLLWTFYAFTLNAAIWILN